MAEIGEKVGKFRTSKGTFRFTEKNRIPDDILKKIVAIRRDDIADSQ